MPLQDLVETLAILTKLALQQLVEVVPEVARLVDAVPLVLIALLVLEVAVLEILAVLVVAREHPVLLFDHQFPALAALAALGAESVPEFDVVHGRPQARPQFRQHGLACGLEGESETFADGAPRPPGQLRTC